jgi:hypothetical protein
MKYYVYLCYKETLRDNLIDLKNALKNIKKQQKDGNYILEMNIINNLYYYII